MRCFDILITFPIIMRMFIFKKEKSFIIIKHEQLTRFPLIDDGQLKKLERKVYVKF